MPTPSLTHSQLTHYPFRFPDYDPAPRHAPREMGILYQIFTRANGRNVNLIWSHIVPSRSAGTPCLAIRSLQDLPTGGPSLRDGHSQLSHKPKHSGACEGGEWNVALG